MADIPHIAALTAGAQPIKWGHCFEGDGLQITVEHTEQGCDLVEIKGAGNIDARTIRALIEMSRRPATPPKH